MSQQTPRSKLTEEQRLEAIKNSDGFDYESKYYMKPWSKFVGAERVCILLNALRLNVLKNPEVETILSRERADFFMTRVLPLGIFPAMYFGGRAIFPVQMKRSLTRNKSIFFSFGLALPIYTFWQYYSPFRASYVEERERLLREVEKRVGRGINTYVELIPHRMMNEYEMMRQLRKIKLSRESILTGTLFP